MRAFVHGRMDLAQAEAVQDIVNAKTLFQAQMASRQHSGELSRRIGPLKQILIDVIVQLESAVEFVEENLATESRADLALKLESVIAELTQGIESFRRGRLIHDGFNLAIVGRPNVGKSSLFNALLAQDRSIVTEIPGTTRDLVAEYSSIGGIPVRLVDTAGVRTSTDQVEQLGVDRSYPAMADADALLLVIDASVERTAEEDRLRARIGDLSGIVVFNKSDLTPRWTPDEMKDYAADWPWICASALSGERIDGLRGAILEHILGDRSPGRDGLLVMNLRHCLCLEAAREALTTGAASLRSGISEEFALYDLRKGLDKLGEVTGETTVEDLLGEIFARFRVGK